MRNLHVICTVNPANGGPIEGLKQLAAVLVAEGHHIEVACLDDPNDPWLKDFPLKVTALGPGKTPWRYSSKLVPWLRENLSRFDAVVINGLWEYNSYGAWKALKGSDVPYFVFTHGMLDPWFNQQYPLKALKKRLFWRWGQFPVLRDATFVLFTSEEEMILARRSFRPYIVREKVVRYGTPGPKSDLEPLRHQFLETIPTLKGRHFLLYLSRIHEKKGCDLLVQAFSELADDHPDVDLVMAGPDKTGLVPKLQTQADSLGVAHRIHWPGMLTGDAKWGAFAAADAFVLPSHQENFGIVVAEALACHTPVLISDKINIWREIKSAGGGLVEADTLEGTRNLLSAWFQLDESSKESMRARARQCFLDNFEITQAAHCLLDVTRNGRDIP